MTDSRKEELNDIGMALWNIKKKLTVACQEEQDYSDSLDNDDVYFERKYADVTVEILKKAIALCDDLQGKIEEACV